MPLAHRAPSHIGDAGTNYRHSYDPYLRCGDSMSIFPEDEVAELPLAPADGTVPPCLVDIRICERSYDRVPAWFVDLIDVNGQFAERGHYRHAARRRERSPVQR